VGDALVLFAHGSREPEWAHPLELLRDLIQRQLPLHEVRLAYLELMAPSLLDAISELASGGAKSVRILPLFLGQGKHMQRDLPTLAESAQKRHPELKLELLPALGDQRGILDALARAIAGTIG
jgi:sirohydrochlorin cobaltochelatase